MDRIATAFKRDPWLALGLIVHALGRNFRLKLFEFFFRSKVWRSTVCSIRKNGYAVVPGYLKPEDVSFLQAVCDKSAEEIDDLRGDAYLIAEAPGSLRLRHMESRHPEMDYFRRHIKIATLSVCLHGRLHWPSVQYSATYDGHDNPDFVSGRAERPFGGVCHVDQWHHQLKAIFLLSDVRLENGPLMIYPGTWRPQWSAIDVYRLKKWNKTHAGPPPVDLSYLPDDNFGPDICTEMKPQGTAVPITGKAGDLVLLDTRTLHFATLIIIAVLQVIYFSINKKYFLYEYNDLYHFILNLFFLNSGFLSAGWSFNGPSWSVSIEIFMYFVFFFVFAFRLRSLFAPLCLAVLGIFLIKHHDVLMFPTIADTVGMGLSCFFIGGLCHMLYEQMLRLNSHQQRLAGNAIAASFFFVFTLVLLATYGAEWAGNAIGDARLIYILAVFPLAVLAGVTENVFRKILDNRVTAHLGDISYSMYLVHIPIQVGIMCLATSVISINFTNGSTIILYVLTCVAVAEMSYFFYEKPAKERLRNLLLGASFGTPLSEGKRATE